MGEDDVQILIDVAFNEGDAAQKAAALRTAIAQLRAENKELQKDTKASTATSADSARQLAQNEKTIKEYNATLKAVNGQLQANTETNKYYGDSLAEQRAQLSQLKTEYASLSKAERQSASGDELRQKIKALNDEVKETEQGFGDFQRSVGNYPKTVTAIIPGFDKLNGVLGSMGTNIQQLSTTGTKGFAALGKSAVAMGKMFLVPPIGLVVGILSLIMIAVQKVSQAFKRNDEASTRLGKAFAIFKPIGTAIRVIFDAIATAISYVVEGFSKLATWLTSKLFPNYAAQIQEAVDAAQELVVAVDNLEQAERDYTVNSAKRNKEIAKLRDQALDKENQSLIP